MTTATTDGLITYYADLLERLDRFAAMVLPPNDGDEAELARASDGSLLLDLEARLPVGRHSADVELDLFERWAPAARDTFERSEYRFELRHRGLDYRRAYHRHDVDHFVRAFDVATHEHCETPIGIAACGHYAGAPVANAIEAFDSLYDLWLTGAPPECGSLRCLG